VNALDRAIVSGANLYRANFGEVNLTGADLRRTNLRGADLYAATLVETDLTGADLTGCRLSAVSHRSQERSRSCSRLGGSCRVSILDVMSVVHRGEAARPDVP
jgi:uncharacterized protein YjbI with pentapeptide repeats